MPKLANHSPRPLSEFLPEQLNQVFAIYLARELNDPVHVGAYARLATEHSMCVLVNALRRARSAARRERVEPEEFFQAVADMLMGEVTL
jgi:hypothetical protein